MKNVHLNDAKKGNTLLSDLEQAFSSLHLFDGEHIMQQRLIQVDSSEELLEALTHLYVAYLYRHHHSRFVNEKEHNYDIELEIADQLLALGVVHFKNFESLTSQFEDEIQADIQHMEQVNGTGESEFIQRLHQKAQNLGEHPTAHHQVLVAVTSQAHFPRQFALVEHLRATRNLSEELFPHVAGVLLIDPTPGREHASFIPFHVEGHELEELLNKRG